MREITLGEKKLYQKISQGGCRVGAQSLLEVKAVKDGVAQDALLKKGGRSVQPRCALPGPFYGATQ